MRASCSTTDLALIVTVGWTSGKEPTDGVRECRQGEGAGISASLCNLFALARNAVMLTCATYPILKESLSAWEGRWGALYYTLISAGSSTIGIRKR